MTRQVEDVLAIQKLMADYNHLIDAGRGEEWADLFVEGGTLDTGMGMVIEGGRDPLVAFASGVPELSPGARHLVTNASIECDGDDATARCYLQMWATSADPSELKLVISGVYHDVLRKVDGTWRYVSRVLHPDLGGPVGG